MEKVAIVLAAGEGQRMLPLSEYLPKPMAPLKGVPLLQRIVDYFDSMDFKRVIVVCRDEDWLIKRFPFVSKNCDVVVFGSKKRGLGNAGHLREVVKGLRLRGLVAVVNSDVLTDFDANILYEVGSNCVVLVRVKDKWSYPVLNEENNKIVDFKEKPDYPHWVNSGLLLVDLSKTYLPVKGGMDWVIKSNSFVPVFHKGFWKTFDTVKDVIEYEQS